MPTQKKSKKRKTTQSKLVPKIWRQLTSKENRRLSFALLFALVGASALVIAYAQSTPHFTLKRQALSIEAVRAKAYPKTSLANIAASASTSIYQGKKCADAWSAEPKAKTSYTYFCWRESDMYHGWTPQGITGSASADSTMDGGNKDILIASWYSTGHPPLAAATQTSSSADSASRVTVVNNQTGKYSHVELVRPCSQSGTRLCKLNSHAGGIAWAGNYFYLASTSGIFVFNLNDTYLIDGKPVIVASEWYDAQPVRGADPRISTISFDPSANQLVTAEYHQADTDLSSRIARWNLDDSHHLVGNATNSAKLFSIKAYSVQGVASYGGSYIAHSSSETTPGRSRKGGTLLAWQKPSSLTRVVMPYHLESAYIDMPHKRVWGITEDGSHSDTTFVLSYPTRLAL